VRRRGDQPPTARPGARALWKTSGVPSAGPAERPRLRPAAQQPRAQLGDGAARLGLDAGRGDGPRILPCRSAPHGCGLRNVQQGRALGVGQLAARREPGSTRRVSSPGAQMTPVSAQGPVPEKPPPVLRAMPPHRRGARPTEDRGALAAGLLPCLCRTPPTRKGKVKPVPRLGAGDAVHEEKGSPRQPARSRIRTPPRTERGARARKTASCLGHDLPPHRSGASPTEDRGALAAGLASAFVTGRPCESGRGYPLFGSAPETQATHEEEGGRRQPARSRMRTPPRTGEEPDQGNRLLFCERCPRPGRRRIKES
jgi:hypothetical protein